MTPFDVDDTIVAIASPPGPGFRGIVRISGPKMATCLEPLFLASDQQPISKYQSCVAIPGSLRTPTGELLPGELLLWPTCQSYTRQPSAEFHTVGSTPVLQIAVKSICDHGARLANPGEFTLRAFLSGRIDLTQAEAVLAVIDADGQQQLSTALRQLAGGLAGPLGKLRDQLLGLLAELEAGLDFVEEDIEFISEHELFSQLQGIQKQLTGIANQILSRELIGEIPKVVLIGMPNSGKSSLFNALTGVQHAIVTDIAGTTTDFVSAQLTVDSTLVELIDTAGFEPLSKPNETGVTHQAQSHRQQQQAQAQLHVFCIDGSRPMTQWETEQLDQLEHAEVSTIVVLTKSDLGRPGPNSIGNPTGAASWENPGLANFSDPVVVASVFDAESLDRIRAELSNSILNGRNSEHTVVGSTVMRAAESLVDAQHSIDRALSASQSRLGEEIVAAEIRQALEGLGQVVGTVYTDDILDLVFGRFCIGK